MAQKPKSILFNDESFENLMQNRIYKILLICSTYDAFILEEDGRIDEQIFNEYVELNLRYPPHFIQVSSGEEALSTLREQDIDLIINMLSIVDMDPLELNKTIKRYYPTIPIVLLTPFSREVNIRLQDRKNKHFDYFFSWLGNSELLLAIIKILEDRINVDYDTKLGVQIILLVEDSVRFYSSYLPVLYKLIFDQAEKFSSEALNEHQRTIRKRARAKILLARNYEEAIKYYEKFKDNLIGIISDVSFPRKGQLVELAGIELTKYILSQKPFMPLLLQSSNEKFRPFAYELGVGFINKQSKKLLHELKKFVRKEFAFGDFVFYDPDTHKEVMRISDLKTLQEKIYQIPDNALKYHLLRHGFSKWLKARALFALGEFLSRFDFEEFKDLQEIRDFIFFTIDEFRQSKSRGVIAQMDLDKYDKYVPFARIGTGSMGGKARGLAFLNLMVKRNPQLNSFEKVRVRVPRTVVLTTEAFTRFMEINNLYEVALGEIQDEQILQAFNKARFPDEFIPYILKFLETTDQPIAIRSSSLLEDSYYQPFAGVYSTYMVPNPSGEKTQTLESVIRAIKCVYASVYFRESKAYMQATQNVIDEEQMAIVLQEIIGHQYDKYFYPLISGVARSINYYPVGDEKPEEGIVNLAFGLGKQIVEGEMSLRFSPAHPEKILQLNEPKSALRLTQKTFYALNMDMKSFEPTADDNITLKKLRLSEAKKHGTLKHVASVYDFENDMLRDGQHYEGKPVITFANFLKYKTYPLAQVISSVLQVGVKEMNLPVEIEFAADFGGTDNKRLTLWLLQIRPTIDPNQSLDENLCKVDMNKLIVYSESALGHGVIKNLHDLIYIKPQNFDPAKNPDLAEQISKINQQMLEQGRNYILIGPGRWGSRDPWLGIPVKWADISAARVIVEAGLQNYQIEPSQGTHFFHNITAFKVGYFTVNDFRGDGYYNVNFLSKLPAYYENTYLRHIRLDKPFVVKIDGKKRIGVIYKPGQKEQKK